MHLHRMSKLHYKTNILQLPNRKLDQGNRTETGIPLRYSLYLQNNKESSKNSSNHSFHSLLRFYSC